MIARAVDYRPEVEFVDPGEAETVQGLMDTFDTILERTAADYGHAVRSVHAKSHGILEGELTVDEGLAPELAQGLFAKPGTHKVFLRLSTNAGDILPDAISLPRGLAMKVLDVPGERLPGSEGTAQDFVMVNAPVFQAKSAREFLGSLKLLAATTDRIEAPRRSPRRFCAACARRWRRWAWRARRSTRSAARQTSSRSARPTIPRRPSATATISPSSA